MIPNTATKSIPNPSSWFIKYSRVVFLLTHSLTATFAFWNWESTGALRGALEENERDEWKGVEFPRLLFSKVFSKVFPKGARCSVALAAPAAARGGLKIEKPRPRKRGIEDLARIDIGPAGWLAGCIRRGFAGRGFQNRRKKGEKITLKQTQSDRKTIAK